MSALKTRLIALLRWSERYTKTDMVYLVTTGFWVNLNLVITSILALLLSVAFANLLPPSTYGLYQYLLSLSALIGALTLGGMNSAVTQAVARGYEGVLRESVRLQLWWGFVPGLMSIGDGIYYFLHGNMPVAIGLVFIGLLVPLISAFNTYAAFLNGKKEFQQGFIFGSVLNIGYYASIFLAVIFLKSAPLLLLVNLASNALILGYLYWRTLVRYRPNTASDPEALSYGKHLSVMNAFGTALTQMDGVLVFHFLGAVELAIYKLATTVPERITGLFKFVLVAAVPSFANQTREEIQKHIIGKMFRAGLAGLLVAGAYALAAPTLFHLLFPRYLAAIPYTQIYSLVIVTGTANLASSALIAQRLKTELYVFNIAQPLILIVLQVVLIIAYGVIGILVARVISNFLGIALSTFLLLRKGTAISD